MKNTSFKERGSILVTMLFMTSILALLVAAVANDSFQSMRSIAQSSRDTQAKYAAYAGLEIALNELRQDESFFGDRELSERHGVLEGEMQGLEKLRYHVLLWNNIQERDSSGRPVGDDLEDMAGPEDVVVRPDTVYIVSSGSDSVRGEEVLLSSMAGTARRIRPIFEDAAYARTKLALSGGDSLVDAWNSSEGWDGSEYVAGSFPGETGGGGGGGGHGQPSPNVKDYEASLGTDSASGRTLRLLDGAKLNGHYRVGPGVTEAQAYGSDSGTTTSSSSDDGTSSRTTYAVTTAQDDDQIAGREPDSGSGIGDEKAVLDSKTTEVPHFESPFSDSDVVGPPTLNNPQRDGKNWKGEDIKLPPEPVALPPGGYSHINVPSGQTLQLTSGVYFFRDEFLVEGGKVTTVGDGPVIVFCGKSATLRNAEVNKEGRTSSLQFCFTDDLQSETELDEVAAEVADIFAEDPEILKNLLSPLLRPDEADPEGPKRAGFSKLEISGDTQFHGSISGKNLVTLMDKGEIFGSVMANVIKGTNAKIHQDLALKGSNVMAAGGWTLEGVHQIR